VLFLCLAFHYTHIHTHTLSPTKRLPCHVNSLYFCIISCISQVQIEEIFTHLFGTLVLVAFAAFILINLHLPFWMFIDLLGPTLKTLHACTGVSTGKNDQRCRLLRLRRLPDCNKNIVLKVNKKSGSGANKPKTAPPSLWNVAALAFKNEKTTKTSAYYCTMGTLTRLGGIN